MNGREKRLLKSKAKVRPVDLKIGKLGLSENFLKEAKKIIKKDGMIKFVLPGTKLIRLNQEEQITKILCLDLVARVGKTATFAAKLSND